MIQTVAPGNPWQVVALCLSIATLTSLQESTGYFVSKVDELMDSLFTTFVAFGVGAISALLGAIFGVGGGFILVPVLNSVLGVPMHLAIGSTVSYVLGPATTTLLFRKVTWRQWRLPLMLSGGLFVGVLLGGQALNSLSRSAIAANRQLLLESVVLGIYLVLLGGLGVFSIWETEREAKLRPVSQGWLKNVLVSPVVTLSEWEHQKISISMYVWFGMSVGFLSGFLGISGGMLIVPGFIYLFAVPSQQTVVNSMILVWIISFQSTIVHAFSGNVDVKLVLALLAGGTMGSRIGTRIGERLGSRQFRRNFGILALGTAAFVGVRLVWLLTRSE